MLRRTRHTLTPQFKAEVVLVPVTGQHFAAELHIGISILFGSTSCSSVLLSPRKLFHVLLLFDAESFILLILTTVFWAFSLYRFFQTKDQLRWLRIGGSTGAVLGAVVGSCLILLEASHHVPARYIRQASSQLLIISILCGAALGSLWATIFHIVLQILVFWKLKRKKPWRGKW